MSVALTLFGCATTKVQKTAPAKSVEPAEKLVAEVKQQPEVGNEYFKSLKEDGLLAPIPGMNILMLRFEVTQQWYELFMGENPSEHKGGDTYPVEMVSWYDAIYFCNKFSKGFGLTPVYSVNGTTDVTQWGYVPHRRNIIEGEVVWNKNANGFRLPTLEEWEYAARGGQNYKYAGSDNLAEVAWYEDNSGDKTHSVAQKKLNGYGLYDMSGNVSEWVWDVKWNLSNFRYTCGGRYRSGGYLCEVSYRYDNPAIDQSGDLGFRIVCPLQ